MARLDQNGIDFVNVISDCCIVAQKCITVLVVWWFSVFFLLCTWFNGHLEVELPCAPDVQCNCMLDVRKLPDKILIVLQLKSVFAVHYRKIVKQSAFLSQH